MENKNYDSKILQTKIQQCLEKELKIRISKNPKYSLRSFAKFLDIAPAYLSRALRGDLTVSKKMIEKICEKLNIDTSECDLYIKESELLKKQLDSYNVRDTELKVAPPIMMTAFKTWHTKVILEMTRINEFKYLPIEIIAKKLKISNKEVSEAISVLIDSGLINKNEDGSYKVSNSIFIPPFMQNPETKLMMDNHHKMILQRSLESIDRTDIKRQHSSVTFAFPEDKFEEVMIEIGHFRRHLAAKMQSCEEEKTTVMELSISLFPWF